MQAPKNAAPKPMACRSHQSNSLCHCVYKAVLVGEGQLLLEIVPTPQAVISVSPRRDVCNSQLEETHEIGRKVILSILATSRRPPPLNSVVSVNIDSLDAALETISSRLSAGQGFNFFTLNLDHLVKLRTDERFQGAYRNADFISADG